MKFRADFPGETTRFEGDRTIVLRGLPAGAQINSARVTITPVAAPGRPLFEETLTFSGDVGDFGMTKVAQTGFVEVDFHTRRTLAAVLGPNIGGAPNSGSELLVDLGGGVFMAINESGAIATPDDNDIYNVPTSGVLPGLTVNKLRLRRAAPSPNVSQIIVRTVPTNVSLALGQLPPFWTRVGEMIQAETSDDFAEFLQLFLNEAEVKDGYYEILLVVHSDALTRLDVAVEIEFVCQQSALPPGVSDVALPYAHDTTAQSESALLQVALPPGAEVTEAAVTVLGSFESSRIAVGPTGPVAPSTAASITAGGQAQPLLLTKIVPASAVDLLLSCTSQAALLDVNVLGDVDGKPFGDPLLPEPVRLELDRDVAETPTWLSARLPEAFQFPANRRVWLVVQAREGEVAWHAVAATKAIAEADPIGLHHSITAGLSWRVTRAEGMNSADDGRLAGLFRLRYVPPEYQVPLAVLVGQGEEAIRVSLDRYQALGRIDFTIDFPEFVKAINEAAGRLGAAGCPRGEQVKNGDFAHWTTVDQRIGEPESVRGVPGTTTVTIAPNGEWAYVGVNAGGSRFLGLPLHDTLSSASLAPLSRQHIAISRDSKRIYVVTDANESPDQLRVIDGENQQPIGDAVALDRPAHCLALSPDGGRLYIGSVAISPAHGQVEVIDTGVLVGLLNSGTDFSVSDARISGDPTSFPNPIPLEEGVRPVSLALSPDGRRLFVAAVDTDTSEGRVYVFDTASHQRLREQPEVVGDDPRDLAVTPDGRWALVVSAAVDAVSVLDAARMRLENTLFLPKPAGASLVPVAVEVSPNGRRAFVANENNQSVSVIDLATWEVSEAIIIAQAPESTIDMAVTPSGDRLYIGLATATLDSTGLFFLPLGRQLPDDWTLTQGFVFALPYGDPYHLTAAFGPVTQEERSARPARPSALSQVTAVTGGCSYDFSFWGIASDANAVAEVIWRGDACSLQRVDRVPIQIVERSAERQVEPGLTNRQAVARALPELRLHRARWQAPAGATQAEIRFIIPAEQNAIADTVSFQATAEAVANGDLLHENEDGEVTGWQVMPATAVGFTVLPDEAGTQLANMGSQAVALVQSFPVTAGQPFILLFQGEMVSQLAAREPARVELRWLDAQDAPTVNVTTLTIQPGETEHRRQETVPTAAAGAELHLVIPAGSTLVARQISFAPVELVTVPIQFLAQAPGDLTVTGFRVAYDVSETAAAPAPAEGLCQPTPPGRRPDGQPGCICPWCPTPCDACDEDSATGRPQPTPVPGPVRAITQPRRTTRPLRVTQPAVAAVVPAVPPIQPVETAIAALIVATPAEWAVRAPELAAASVPLAVINGIGAERTVALAGLGIDSIPRLAAAGPESIAALRGVSANMARAFVAEAQAMVANPETLPAPLVSCIMPTYNRRHFVAKAIELFQRQEYPNRELIILDDGDEPVEDLAPDDETIRYVRLAERQSIGQKRNIGCQAARGPIIAHWDDDVWVAPWRLSYQVAALIENEADLCGLDNLLHYDLLTGQAWHSVRPPGREPWLPGNTFCYRKSLWQERPFGDRSVGSDIAFLRQRPGAKSVALQAITWLVDIIHGQNASPKDGRNPLWRPYPVAEIQQLLGEDWAFYVQLGQKNPIGTDGR